MSKLIAMGAEAKIFQGKTIVKDRVRKSYRISEIDNELRKSRTRREAKVLEKLAANNILVPQLIKTDRTSIIEMEFIDGQKVRDVLDKNNNNKIITEVAKNLAKMHNIDIIHGDLTTSNMILVKNKVCFIDFGLSVFSKKIEDKAVDVHLFRQALESKHDKIWKKCYAIFTKEYFKAVQSSKEVAKRLEIIESRGRNKTKK